MCPVRSDNDAACLQVTIDLLEKSDAYASTEPRLARQYARQAYELGRRSPRLRHSITRERIRMIVQHSDQRRIAENSDAVPLRESDPLRHLKKAGFMGLFILAGSLFSSTPVSELPDQRVTLARAYHQHAALSQLTNWPRNPLFGGHGSQEKRGLFPQSADKRPRRFSAALRRLACGFSKTKPPGLRKAQGSVGQRRRQGGATCPRRENVHDNSTHCGLPAQSCSSIYSRFHSYGLARQL